MPAARTRKASGRAGKRAGWSGGRHLPLLLCLLCLLGLWTAAGPFGLWKYGRLKSIYKSTYYENLQAAKSNRELEEQIRRLQSDSDFQEMVVRHDLGWVRDNEILYVFMDD